MNSGGCILGLRGLRDSGRRAGAKHPHLHSVPSITFTPQTAQQRAQRLTRRESLSFSAPRRCHAHSRPQEAHLCISRAWLEAAGLDAAVAMESADLGDERVSPRGPPRQAPTLLDSTDALEMYRGSMQGLEGAGEAGQLPSGSQAEHAAESTAAHESPSQARQPSMQRQAHKVQADKQLGFLEAAAARLGQSPTEPRKGPSDPMDVHSLRGSESQLPDEQQTPKPHLLVSYTCSLSCLRLGLVLTTAPGPRRAALKRGSPLTPLRLPRRQAQRRSPRPRARVPNATT